MKASKYPAKEKNEAREAKRKGQDCFLRMPELRNLRFCIWIIRPQSVRPVNGFVVSLSSL